MIKTILKRDGEDCYFRLTNRSYNIGGVRLTLCDENRLHYTGYNLIAITNDGLIQIDGIFTDIKKIELCNGCLIINNEADEL